MKTASAGFTLVEMLVALFVFSLLAGAGAGLIGFSLNSKDALGAASNEIQNIQVARATMKADLGQIALRPVRDAYGGRGPFAFEGGRPLTQVPLLAFVRGGRENPMGSEVRSSLQYVEYTLEGGVLVRRARAHLDATPDTPIHSRPLLDDIEEISVSFFSGGVWSDRWRAQRTGGVVLPDAIALDAEITGLGRVRQVFLTPGQ